ncbi:MAG: ABC transporter permease [Acidobacteria bacterium]|jgi:putative ABC transport system permease protein|nr:ABC transporter permease [Acidobacteriota bacterium]
MTFTDTLLLAFRNLRQSRLRTSLTTLGVAIGIASLAGMVSLGVGLQEQVVGRLTQSGVFDSITVTSGRANIPGLGGMGRGRAAGRGGQGGQGSTTPTTPAAPLDDAAVARFAALSHVRDAYPTLRIPMSYKYDGRTNAALAAGIPESSRGEGAFQSITHGTFFPDATGASVMLTLEMAQQLNADAPASLVGQTLELSYADSAPNAGGTPEFVAGVQVTRVSLPFTIVGIVERDPAPGANLGLSAVMIPLEQAKAINARAIANPQAFLQGAAPQTRRYTGVTVRVNSAANTQDVQDQIKAMGFTAFSLNDALQGAKRAFLLLDILLALVGSIALAVSSLGIVNTMVMSILERTREIGIMKAIGGSDRDVRGIFLVEAATIGLIGGVAGIVLGWGVGRLINIGANIYIERQGGTAGDLFSLPWWLILGAMAFALVVSLVAGSYPARRAARLDPIQALRHE